MPEIEEDDKGLLEKKIELYEELIKLVKELNRENSPPYIPYPVWPMYPLPYDPYRPPYKFTCGGYTSGVAF